MEALLDEEPSLLRSTTLQDEIHALLVFVHFYYEKTKVPFSLREQGTISIVLNDKNLLCVIFLE
jgi:hypothetical protein